MTKLLFNAVWETVAVYSKHVLRIAASCFKI